MSKPLTAEQTAIDKTFYLFYAAPGYREYSGFEANDHMLDAALTSAGLSLTVDNLKTVFPRIKDRLAVRSSVPVRIEKAAAVIPEEVSTDPWGVLTADSVAKMSGEQMGKWMRHSDPKVRQRFKDQVNALQINESEIHSASNKMDPKRSAPIL